jgi:hypothetical protein
MKPLIPLTTPVSTRRWRAPWAIATAIVALSFAPTGLGGCGDDDDDSTNTDGNTDGTTGGNTTGGTNTGTATGDDDDSNSTGDTVEEGLTDFESVAMGGGRNGTPDAGEDAGSADGGGGESRTVEEADIVRVDGNTLYVVNPYRGLVSFDITNPDKPKRLARLGLTGTPVDMYFRDNRAYVIIAGYYGYGWEDGVSGADADEAYYGSRLVSIDTTNPANPKVLGAINIAGYISDSRLVGDVIYLVSTRYSWLNVDGASNYSDQTDIVSVNIDDPANMKQVDKESFDGSSWYIHVTQESPYAVYIASNSYSQNGNDTTITYVDIDDPKGAIALRGDASVPGYIQDKFKLDAYEGVLRAVTYQWNEQGVSHLTTIDFKNADQPKELATLSLARGESLFATRFAGPRAYVVTYLRVDPLWVLDLSNPASPTVAGELKVPGYSQYIEPRGDRLITLGTDDTDGKNRVAVSLFDVADATKPTLIKSLSFGSEYAWSAGQYDEKAFRVDDASGLIIVPISGWSYTPGSYGRSESFIQFIDFTKDTLTARGYASMTGTVNRGWPVAEKNRVFALSSEVFHVVNATDRDSPVVTAALDIARNVTQFTPVADSNVAVSLVGQYDYGAGFSIRALSKSDPDGDAVGTLDLDAQYGTLVDRDGKPVLVAGSWASDASGNPRPATVSAIDVSTPAAPKLGNTLDLPAGTQAYSYGGWWGGGVEDGGGPAADTALTIGNNYYGGGLQQTRSGVVGLGWYPPNQNDKPNFVNVSPDEIPDTTEWGTPGWAQSGFVQLVDLRDATKPALGALLRVPYGSYFGNQAFGDAFYFAYYRPTERTDEFGNAIYRYYYIRVDVTDPKNPIVEAPVNIPGQLFWASDDGRSILTLEWHYERLSEPTAENPYGTTTWYQTIYSLDAKNGKAFLRDAKRFDNNSYGSPVVDGNIVYWSQSNYTYDQATQRGTSTLSISPLRRETNGKLTKLPVFTQAGGGYLVGAGAQRLFVTPGYFEGLLVLNATDPAALKTERFIRTQGWVSQIVVDGDTVYLPKGYYGIESFKLK